MDSSLIAAQLPAWRSVGYIVTAAHSVREAIDHFKSDDFDLVLLGHSIPAESRERLTFLIRASRSLTPVICIANSPDEWDAFADATITDEPDKLLQKLGEFMAKKASVAGATAAILGNRLHAKGKNADTAKRRTMQNRPRNYPSFSLPGKTDPAERQTIESDLRHALERKEMTLHYQPKIELKTGAVIGAEAFCRWMHPTRGLVPPAQFIPIAEESGMILKIGAWILHKACSQARAWVDAGIPARTVTVKISENQLQDRDFLGILFATLSTTGLDPQFLELEITADVLMKNPDPAASILRVAKDKGVHVSADNLLSSGFSLSSLRTLPLAALKIGPSFVRRIDIHCDDNAKVRAMIRAGQSLHLRVIAGGVETAEHLEFLWDHCCDEAQGYYIGRPVPPEQLSDSSQRDYGIATESETEEISGFCRELRTPSLRQCAPCAIEAT
jgi:EAL domain-containing protein (putative c-di-GMP-specific phosphodiesterase class I)